MSPQKRNRLTNYLFQLKQARAEAFAEGNWERVDFIQLCIDDVNAELSTLS